MKKYVLLFIVIGMLSGCGVSPEPDYYILSTTSGQSVDLATQIKVERPILPAYLDRPQIVEIEGKDRVTFDEMQRWAAPLDSMIEDVFAEDLRQRMPVSLVTTEKESNSHSVRFVVQPTITTFNSIDDHDTLNAEINIDDNIGCNTHALSSLFTFNSTLNGPREEVLSQLIGVMSDFVVQNLVTLNLKNLCPLS